MHSLFRNFFHKRILEKWEFTFIVIFLELGRWVRDIRVFRRRIILQLIGFKSFVYLFDWWKLIFIISGYIQSVIADMLKRLVWFRRDSTPLTFRCYPTFLSTMFFMFRKCENVIIHKHWRPCHILKAIKVILIEY